MDDFLAPYRQSEDPLREAMREERKREIDATIRVSPDAAKVAKANAIGRASPLPPAVIETMLPDLEEQRRVKGLFDFYNSTPRLDGFNSNPRNMAAIANDTGPIKKAHDAFVAERLGAFLDRMGPLPRAKVKLLSETSAGRMALALYEQTRKNQDALDKQQTERINDYSKSDGFWDRLGDTLGRGSWAVGAGWDRFRSGVQEVGAIRLPWQSDDEYRRARAISEVRSLQAQRVARQKEAIANTPLENEATWAEVKQNPWALGRFVRDQGLGSLPMMANAVVNPVGQTFSMSGQIAQTRAVNDGRRNAGLGDVAIAAPVAAASTALDRFGFLSSLGAKGATVAGRIGYAAGAESATEFTQSALEYAGGSTGTKKGFDPVEAFEQGIAGALVGGAMGGAIRGGVETASKVKQVYRSRREGAFLDRLNEAASESELRKNDPEGFRQAIEEMAGGSGVDNIYIPAEDARILFQADFDAWRDFEDDWSDAVASGGDFVLPVDVAAQRLAGTPEWDQLRDVMRLTPGGISTSEAKSFEDAMADVMAEFDSEAQSDLDGQKADMQPREVLFERVATKLQDAGFTPTNARTQAELLVNRYSTRASRAGAALTGQEFNVDVRSVVPESLSRAAAKDELQIAFDAMRAPRKEKAGPSLISFVRSNGGVDDIGGDLAAMGFGRMRGVSKRDQTKLIRRARGDIQGQESLLGDDGGTNTNTPDELALRAWEAGLMPEFSERPTVNQFLDALANEERGGTRATEPNAGDDLREYLERSGYDADAVSYDEVKDLVRRNMESDGEGFYQGDTIEIDGVQRPTVNSNGQPLARADGDGSYNYVVFDDSAVSIKAYEQAYGDGPRGRIVFDKQQTVIELFKARNPSTFLHEAGHLFLEELRFDAAQESAPEQVKSDWGLVEKWFTDNGHDLTGGIPTEAHELWARGFERYLMEGKAPSTALRKAFQTFKSWMISVYRAVAKLNAPITDEIRGVMDRLIATDEEIAEAREESALEAKFTEAVGMSGPEFEAYRKMVEQAQSNAHDTMLAKAMTGVKKSVTKEHKARRDALRAEVAEDVDTLPEFKAVRAMRATPVSREWLVDRFGPEAPDQILKAVPPLSKNGGADPGMIAALSGYADAEEMIRTVMGLETQRVQLREAGDKRSPRDVLIDQQTDALLMERYGDPFTDGTIEREALAAVHSDAQGEVLAAELRVFARSTGQRATPYRLAKQWAREKIRAGVVNDVASPMALQRYRRASSSAGRKAMAAVIAGDNAEAFRQTQAQMLQNALIAEGKAALDEVESAVARMQKWASRKTIKSVDQDYLEQAHALLEQIDLKPRSQRQIDRVQSFAAWAVERANEGFDVVVPDAFADLIGVKNWSRLSVEHLMGVDAAVKQIIHLGRLKQTLLDNKEQRDFAEVKAEAIAAMPPQQPPKPVIDPSFFDRVKSGISTMDAALLKMETVFDWLDQGSTNGVFNRVVFRPIADAQSRENAMLADYQGRIAEAFKPIVKPRLMDRIEGHGLLDRETGTEWVLTRQNLLAVALNMGNEGNLQRLLDGYGWNDTRVREVLNENLSQDEWTFVQNVWDIINTLWPDVAALERRINGVEPDKVEASPVETPFGTLKGGYYPAIYDSRLSYEAERNDASALFEGGYTKATTRASSTKARAEKVKRPISLQLGVINRHLSETIHDITHREPLMTAWKLLNDPSIMKAVDQSLGREIRKQFNPWMQFLANQWAIERSGAEGLGRFLDYIRSNVTMVGMGMRVTTVISQIAGYLPMASYIGPQWIAHGFSQTAKHNIKAREFVTSRSGEVRDRILNIDRDVTAAINRLSGKRGVRAGAMRFAFASIGFMDQMVVIPSWLGAYNKALSEGLDEAEAIYAADKAIRLSQGAASAKDLASVARAQGKYGALLKPFTMFYTYNSSQYGLFRSLYRDFKNPGLADYPVLLAQLTTLLIVSPMAAQILSGRGPEEDEDWGWWTFKEALWNLTGPFPVVRDLLRPTVQTLAGEQSFGYTLSPVQSAGDALLRSMGDLRKLYEGEELKRPIRNTLETIGYLTGTVTGQQAIWAQAAADIWGGELDPRTVSEWWEVVRTGKIDSSD